MSSWVTYQVAAEILDTHVSNVAKLVGKGELVSRGGRSGSLSRAEVEALDRRRRAHKAELAARGPSRYRRVDHRPDQEHDWVNPREVAARLGVTTVTVRRRIDRETLPGTAHEGYYWMRREHLELVEKAQRGPEVLKPWRVCRAPTAEGPVDNHAGANRRTYGVVMSQRMLSLEQVGEEPPSARPRPTRSCAEVTCERSRSAAGVCGG